MAIPFFHAFRSTNRGRGPKYTVPCPKGRPRRTRRQGEDAERRRAQKDISGPAVHADGGTGGRHSPLLSDGGMVGQRRPGDVYKMRLQIGVHNGAFCCSGTLMKRRKFNGGKRCRLAFHAVDRGSNPLGDANEIMPLREIVRAFFVLRHFQKMSVHPSDYSAAIPTTLSQTYYSGRRVIRHHEHSGTPYPCRALAF